MRPMRSRKAGGRTRVLLSTRLNHDDIVLLVSLIKAYLGEGSMVARVAVSGYRTYVWEDLDMFVEQCPRLSQALLLSLRAASDGKTVEIDFRRKTTRLTVRGPDDQSVRRYQSLIADFLMSARPRLWPSYKLFFATPKASLAATLTLLAIGYLSNREFILYTLVLIAYVACSALWLNPTRITFKDRDQLRADATNRTQRLVTTPVSVIGGVLGIVSTGIVIAGHLH